MRILQRRAASPKTKRRAETAETLAAPGAKQFAQARKNGGALHI